MVMLELILLDFSFTLAHNISAWQGRLRENEDRILPRVYIQLKKNKRSRSSRDYELGRERTLALTSTLD